MTAYVVTAPLVQALVDAETGVYTHVYQGGTLPSNVDKDQLAMLLADGMIEESDGDEDEAPSGVRDILANVGEDKNKAQAALDAENAEDKPRKTLVEKLQAVLDKP